MDKLPQCIQYCLRTLIIKKSHVIAPLMSDFPIKDILCKDDEEEKHIPHDNAQEGVLQPNVMDEYLDILLDTWIVYIDRS